MEYMDERRHLLSASHVHQRLYSRHRGRGGVCGAFTPQAWTLTPLHCVSESTRRVRQLTATLRDVNDIANMTSTDRMLSW
jgi:hypothetical protein